MAKIRQLGVCLLIVVLLVVIGGIVNEEKQSARRQAEAAAALEAAQRPYLAELTEIKTELTRMDREYKDQITHMATVHILFAEADARIMTEALPMMTNYGYVGMVAVDASCLPGTEGCLTVAQHQELAAQGWGLCLSANVDTDIPALYQQVAEAGLPIPQAVYFPEGDCTLQQEEVIRDLGIAAVIQYGSAYPADAPAGTLWYLEARAAYDSQNGNALLWAINNSTGMALTEGWQQPRELFSTEDFQQSLDFLVAYVAMGKAEVANVSQAWQQRFEAEQIRKAEEQSWLDRRESLVQRQAEIEQALRELGSKQ